MSKDNSVLLMLAAFRKPIEFRTFCDLYREASGKEIENQEILSKLKQNEHVVIEDNTLFIPDLIKADHYLLLLFQHYNPLLKWLKEHLFLYDSPYDILSTLRVHNLFEPYSLNLSHDSDVIQYLHFVFEHFSARRIDYNIAPDYVVNLFSSLFESQLMSWEDTGYFSKLLRQVSNVEKQYLKSEHLYLGGYQRLFMSDPVALEHFAEFEFYRKHQKGERYTFEAIYFLETGEINEGLKKAQQALKLFQKKDQLPHIYLYAQELFVFYALLYDPKKFKAICTQWYQLEAEYTDEIHSPLLSLYTKKIRGKYYPPTGYEYHEGGLYGLVDALAYAILVPTDQWDEQRFETIAEDLYQNGYRWLAYHFFNILDLGGYLSDQQEKIFKELKRDKKFEILKPVINTAIEKKFSIKSLSRLIENELNGVVEATESHQRLIWILSHGRYDDELIPYIQTKSKSGEWTRGRKIKPRDLKYSSYEKIRSLYDDIILSKINTYYNDEAKLMDIFSKLPGIQNIYHEDDRQQVLFEKIKYPVYLYDKKGGFEIVVPELDLENDQLEQHNLIERNSHHYQVITLEPHTLKLLQELKGKTLTIPDTPEGDQLLNHWVTKNRNLELKAPFFIPSGITPVEVKGYPRVLVEIEWQSDNRFVITPKITPASGWPPYLPGEKGLTRVRKIDGGYERLKRIKSRETKVMKQLFTRFDLEKEPGKDHCLVDHFATIRLLLSVANSESWLTVSWLNSRKQIRQVDVAQFKWKLSEKNHWFQLDGTLELSVEEQFEITDLMEKIDQKGFITLDSGELLILDQQLQKELKKLKKMAILEENQLLIPPVLSDQVDQLHFLKRIKRTDRWQKQIETLQKLSSQKIKLPKEIKDFLWSYQQKGVRWITKTTGSGFGACLADDMGLGKTVQAIASISLNPGNALIITPASVLYNWQNEINRFAPEIDVKLYEGAEREGLLNKIDQKTAIVVSYDTFQKDSKHFLDQNWSWIILDEAQMIKNDTTKRSRAIFKLKGERRVALSGTPIENHLGELWSLFHFLNPQLLGTKKEFNNRFVKPISKGDRSAHSVLKKMLTPFLLRRIKKDVLKELPDKTEKILWLTYKGKEKTYYEALRRDALKASKGIQESDDHGGTKRIQILTHLLKLRQATCDISLLGKTIEESEKTKKALDLIEQIIEADHKTLVFSQFTSYLSRIKEALEKREIPYLSLDGSTTKQARQKLVDQFQTDNIPVFLISLKAGGTGLNLTAANYVIHLDPWWNPAVEDQATDRTHRIGQSEHVTVYKLIVKNSIEEKIIALHEQKRDLSSSILDQMDQKKPLSLDQLVELLK